MKRIGLLEFVVLFLTLVWTFKFVPSVIHAMLYVETNNTRTTQIVLGTIFIVGGYVSLLASYVVGLMAGAAQRKVLDKAEEFLR